MSRLSPKNRTEAIDSELRAIDALLTELARRRRAGDNAGQLLGEAETRLRRLRRRISRHKRLAAESASTPGPRRKAGAGHAR